MLMVRGVVEAPSNKEVLYLLFCCFLYVNDLVQSLSERISVSAFVDDLAIRCSDRRVSLCNEKLQNACDIVKHWCKE